jgi:hypothetical protein
MALGEPDVGRLYLTRTDDTLTPGAFLCIQGAEGFARTLAGGHFVTVDSEDLAVASNDSLVVISALETLPFNADPAADCVPLESLVARRLDCSRLRGTADCGGLLSDIALAAADLDSNGRDELLVGIPSESSRGNDAAGKIRVTSFAKDPPTAIEEMSSSSSESGDRLGTAVVGIPLSRPEAVLAGAPGGNKLATFFCSSLLPPGKGGARCN